MHEKEEEQKRRERYAQTPAVYNTYSAILRGTGDSRAPFLVVLVSSAANIVPDLIFAAGQGYGTAGAAAATVISQSLMCIYIIAYTIRKYPFLRFSPGRCSFDPASCAKGAKFGLPPAVQSGISSAGNVYLRQFMNGFGEQTVAAITAAYRVDTVIFLPIINLSSGIATIVAQNTGANHRKRKPRLPIL